MQEHEKAFHAVVEKAKKYDSLLWLEKSNILHCSFCGRDQDKVNKLVAGPKVYICNKCIELCVGILEEEQEDSNGQG
ncbi:hypothetical protein GCM10007111_08690 [Virgibacillus kapii]|uniref:ClpX-type ZB domain-containing protein n=1 Tax=Virgibacillus kapii TaxID=1638645 RepID=A0ABQ2D7L2_9BACI|nr:hypothetical protein GCM10007111_08690 [Virgibacillus kapii]